MFHNLKVERIFNLGDYKNVKVAAETTDISDEDWIDPIRMDNIRKDLELEVYMNFALSQEIESNNREMFQNREWSLMYERFRTDRHQEDYSPILESNVVFDNPEELVQVDEI